MYYNNKERKEKKKIYGTRKFKKRLVSCALGVIFAIGAASIPAVFKFDNSVVSALEVKEDTTRQERWQKVYHSYYAYNKVEADATKAANIDVTPASDGGFNVKLTYNAEGIYHSGNYISTSRPWFSFAISNGYDIEGKRSYKVFNGRRGMSSNYEANSYDKVPDFQGVRKHDNLKGKAEGYWNLEHVGIIDVNKYYEFHEDLYNAGIDKTKLGYWDLFQMDTGQIGQESMIIVEFKIKPNSSFQAGKEYIVANYKTFDINTLDVANTIWHDVQEHRNYNLSIEPLGKEIELNKDIIINYGVSDGNKYDVIVNPSSKKSETVTYKKLYQKGVDNENYTPFTGMSFSVEGQVGKIDGEAVVIEYEGKKYDFSILKRVDKNANTGLIDVRLLYSVSLHTGSDKGIKFDSISIKDGTVNKIYNVGEKINSDAIVNVIQLTLTTSTSRTVNKEVPLQERELYRVKLSYMDGTSLDSRGVKVGDVIYFEAVNNQNSSNKVSGTYVLNVVDTTALLKLIEKVDSVKTTDRYNFADKNLRDRLDLELADANDIIRRVSERDSTVTQQVIQTAFDALDLAEKLLNGDDNLEKATNAVAEAERLAQAAKEAVTNADKDKDGLISAEEKSAVDTAIQAAKDAKANAETEVGKLNEGSAKAGLADRLGKVTVPDTVEETNVDANGIKEAKEALESEVAKKDDVKSSNNYQNADEDKKKAYDDALAKAEEVLNNSNATKEDLDNARKALEEAREALNGSDNKVELGAPTFTDSLPAFTGFDELNKAAEDKINEVNNSNLTDAEKEALKQIINNILKEAVNSILNTKNAQEAEKLKDNALNKLLSIVVGKSNIDNKDNKKKDIVTNKLPNTGVDSSNLFGILGAAGIFAAALKRKKEDEE